MRISDWSSDVCSSDLPQRLRRVIRQPGPRHLVADVDADAAPRGARLGGFLVQPLDLVRAVRMDDRAGAGLVDQRDILVVAVIGFRSEEHTSELPSLMRVSDAVYCWKKITNRTDTTNALDI